MQGPKIYYWPPYSNRAVIEQAQSSNRAVSPIAQSGFLHFSFQSVCPNRANRQFCSNRVIFTSGCPQDCFPSGRDAFRVSSAQSLNRSWDSNRVNRVSCAIAQSGTRSNRANRSSSQSGNRASASIGQSFTSANRSIGHLQQSSNRAARTFCSQSVQSGMTCPPVFPHVCCQTTPQYFWHPDVASNEAWLIFLSAASWAVCLPCCRSCCLWAAQPASANTRTTASQCNPSGCLQNCVQCTQTSSFHFNIPEELLGTLFRGLNT